MIPAMQYADWVDSHYQRMDQAARATLDHCSLIATFTSGIAAGFIAAGYQVADPSHEGVLRAGTGLLAASVLCALLLFFALNQLEDVDLEAMQDDAQATGTPEGGLILTARAATIAAAMKNRRSAQTALRVASVQAALAIAAAAFACWALLDRLA